MLSLPLFCCQTDKADRIFWTGAQMSVEKQEILRQGEREDTAALRASLEESRKACEAMR